MRRKNVFLLVVNMSTLIFFTTGFRTFSSKTPWNISVSDPKLFLKFCERPAITTNDYETGDPLFGQTLSFNIVLQSIISDFNTIPSSFVVLADADTDSESATKSNRTIHVCFEQTTGGGGEARPTLTGSYYTSCTIKMSPGTKNSARSFTKTLTHEIGHCLGLDHTQETVYSVMSYFSDPRTTRLQMDDMMALVFLYPTESKYAQEAATLGLSCTPKS